MPNPPYIIHYAGYDANANEDIVAVGLKVTEEELVAIKQGDGWNGLFKGHAGAMKTAQEVNTVPLPPVKKFAPPSACRQARHVAWGTHPDGPPGGSAAASGRPCAGDAVCAGTATNRRRAVALCRPQASGRAAYIST